MSGAEFELLKQNTIWLRDHCAFLNKRIKELEAALSLARNEIVKLNACEADDRETAMALETIQGLIGD